MSDLISRQAAIDAINGLPKCIDTENGVCLDYADVIAVLSDHLLSAQPERKTGKWIRLTNDLAQCSECEDYIDNAISCGYNYCPNCGADMKGEENGKNG